MSETIVAKGTCLCGAVSVNANTVSTKFGACHCNMCRNWGGGPLLATECGTDVTFGGEESIAVYDSSDWAERGFCKLCGTHLFYRLKEAKTYHIPVGLFPNLGDMTFSTQVFIDSKPDWYSFTADTHNLTGEELFAMYAPPEN